MLQNRGNIEFYSGSDGSFKFEEQEFKVLSKVLNLAAKEIWKEFTPKEADSLSSDYYEWYDKESDCDANLTLLVADTALIVDPAPLRKNNLLYRFNKRRMQSFIYDLNKEGKADE